MKHGQGRYRYDMVGLVQAWRSTATQRSNASGQDVKTASKELQSKYGVTPGLAILEAWRFREDPREANCGAILLL